MAQDVSYVNHLPRVLDRRNQPAAVMAYIEDHKAPRNIRISPTVPNISKTLPIGAFHYLIPGI
jgi:hypothetical protein